MIEEQKLASVNVSKLTKQQLTNFRYQAVNCIANDKVLPGLLTISPAEMIRLMNYIKLLEDKSGYELS